MDRSSHEYHAHISTILKAPSLIHGAPQYPNVHKAFNHDHRAYYEDLQQPKPKPKKRVQLMDPAAGHVAYEAQVVDYDDDESSVDSEADGFIQHKVVKPVYTVVPVWQVEWYDRWYNQFVPVHAGLKKYENN
ncbi:unnamed protein product [Linum tenue]|uniref:Chromo domain-containing protein n=1 Tax=Linum tenue TaxID=586396 RepID=A0AAV0MZ27_9ROSI|nr:unnamed protein product [Linum tenue]